MRILLTLLALLALPTLTLAAELTNPLGTTDLRVIIQRIIQAILGLSGSIALLAFIWGGFLWLSSHGSPEQVKKAKDVIRSAVIGLAIIVGAYIMVTAVVTILESGTVT